MTSIRRNFGNRPTAVRSFPAKRMPLHPITPGRARHTLVWRWTGLLVLCLAAAATVLSLQSRLGLAQTGSEPPANDLAYVSRLRIHNPDPAQVVACELTLIDGAGTEAGQSLAVRLRPRVTEIVDLNDLSDLATGAYAGYLDCSHAVSTVLIYGEPGDRIYTAYAGTDEQQTSREWQVLEAYTGFGNSEFATSIIVQNAGAEPNDLTIRFLSRRDGSLIHTISLSGLPAWSTTEADLVDFPALAEHETVRAEVASSGPSAVLVFHHDVGDDDNDSAFRFPRAAFVPSHATATRFAYPAMLVNYQDLNTTFQVLGMGSEPVRLSVAYPGFGTQEWELTPGRVTTIGRPGFMPKGSYVASVVITASHPIAMQAHTRHANGSIAVLTATEQAGTKVSAPLILRRRDGFSSMVTCQNLGDQATEVIFEHVGRFARIKYAEPGHSITRHMAQENLLPNNYDGTMVIRAEQPIKCVVAQLRNPPTDEDAGTVPVLSEAAEVRSLLVYEGLATP
ncbi:MAG: hypothetical protein OXG36_11750 [Caldilineaceae bacterium]|nr:hypothetical protein [Caldilineaceae bacterium]